MKLFGSMVLYAAIGGVVMFPLHDAVTKRCGGPGPTTQTFAATVIVWPAIVSASVMYALLGPKSDGDFCTNDYATPPHSADPSGGEGAA